MLTLKKRSAKWQILLFLLPALILYILVQIVPLGGALYFSVSSWNGIGGSPMKFVGLKNFTALLDNEMFVVSMKNLGRLVFFSVLFHTPIALIIAVILYQGYKGHRLFKAMYFIPTLFPLTAVGLLWYFIFMPNGYFNSLLTWVGLEALVQPWLVQKSTAMNTIIFVNIWAGIGYFMVIILAGLTTIPLELYEAGTIDGASSRKQFTHITIPMLKPILGMCILMDIIGTIKSFDLVFAMTEGGPNGLTNLPTTLMYYESFRYNHYGLGSAIGVVLLIISLIATLGSEALLRKREV